MKIKYAIIGTGACGGVVGASLHKAGIDICFYARSDFQHIKSHGIKLLSNHESDPYTINSADITVYNKLTAMPKCDVLLLCVKSYANHELLPALKNILKPESIIVSLQNGFHIKELINSHYSNLVIPTVPWLKTTRIASGGYRHDFGRLIQGLKPDNNNKASDGIICQIQTDFKNSGFDFKFDANFYQSLWTKTVLNVPLFVLCIKHNLASKEMLATEPFRREYQQLKEEVSQVAKVEGIVIDQELINSIEAKLVNSEELTYPSMKVDYDNKRELEIAETILPIIDKAQTNKIQVPKLIEGYRLLVELSKGSQSKV